MQNVNHNVWARRHTQLTHATKIIIISSGILLGILTLALVIVTTIKQHTLARLAQYQQELTHEAAELDVLIDQKKLFETDAKQLDQRWNKVQKISCSSTNNPYLYLQKISKIIPDQVALTTFKIEHALIHLEGMAPTVPEITKFMSALAKSGLGKAPTLVTLDRGKKHANVHFSINIIKT